MEIIQMIIVAGWAYYLYTTNSKWYEYFLYGCLFGIGKFISDNYHFIGGF